MVKFDEKDFLDNLKGALALRPQIEKLVDDVFDECEKLCWLGIGGTWASCQQAHVHMKEVSTMDTFVLNAAEYLTTGDLRVDDKTIVVISSVTGTTQEIVDAVAKVQAAGARVIGFIDKEESALATAVDWCVSFPKNEQLKFFMVADRFLQRRGEFPKYETFYAQLEKALPEGLVAIEKSADEFGLNYAKAHMNDKLHYFVGAGTFYGATYSYAMCYWEEMHWIRTKSIHSAEFFHGMLEIIDPDTPVTVFVTEDSQRPLSERVARFLAKYNENHTIIDAANYPLPGLDDEFRGYVSHHIIHAVTNRIDAHLEALSGHDMNLRRYYRKVEY